MTYFSYLLYYTLALIAVMSNEHLIGIIWKVTVEIHLWKLRNKSNPEKLKRIFTWLHILFDISTMHFEYWFKNLYSKVFQKFFVSRSNIKVLLSTRYCYLVGLKSLIRRDSLKKNNVVMTSFANIKKIVSMNWSIDTFCI